MRWVRDQNCELHFVIFKDNAVSLDLLKTIPEENIYKLCPDNLFSLGIDTLKFLAWCRRKEIDTVIDLELFSRVTSLMSRMSGAITELAMMACMRKGCIAVII